jgi:hypothetical protein
VVPGVRCTARVCLGTLLFFAVIGAPRAARGEPVASHCPERAEVLRALQALSAHVAGGAPAAHDDLQLSTEDAGDAYRVSVNGRTRSYADAHRDCAERARVAAVFAALVLSSPNDADLGSEAEPAPSPAVIAKPPAPIVVSATTGRRARPWWFDAGAVAALAPDVSGPPFDAAAELGFAYVPDDWGGAIGLRLPAVPSTLPLGDTTAHLLRTPLDLVGRWVVRVPPFCGALDAGAVLSLLRLRQAEDSGRSTRTRLEPGLRIATRWQLENVGISPYFELFSEVIPVRYQLGLEPTGVLAKTPGLWLGAALGVSAHFN